MRRGRVSASFPPCYSRDGFSVSKPLELAAARSSTSAETIIICVISLCCLRETVDARWIASPARSPKSNARDPAAWIRDTTAVRHDGEVGEEG